MPGPKERILVVENDPMVADLISRQVLAPLGYEVKIVADGSSALQAATDFAPDVVIANLNLPGLSGKDLMVGFSSQVITFPVIMIASVGKEKDVIQAFRLGASDYIGSPVREAELLSAVERALEQVRARQERRRLAVELQRANKQLGKRVKELTTIFGIGKAVTSITSQDKLYEAILEGALNITESEIGWLLIQDEVKGEFILTAH
ncbi:MAG: response regulator, partial [Chloroflexi bacterium]|nr:response regulator [Chloroflexota bacterium]